MRTMLSGTLVTVMTNWKKQHTQTDDTELLGHFHGSLQDADPLASQVYASATRHFQEACEVPSRVKSARGDFPFVCMGAFDGLAQPSSDLQSLEARARRARRKERLLSAVVASLKTLVHLESCQRHQPHVRNLVHQCTRNVRQKLARLVVDHITLLGFVLISACCVAELGIMRQHVPTKGKATPFSPGERAFGTYALGSTVFDAKRQGATVNQEFGNVCHS